MRAKQSTYNSYLLRIWKEGAGADWRASLQDIASGEFKYFASLGELNRFLEQPPQCSDGEQLAVSGAAHLSA